MMPEEEPTNPGRRTTPLPGFSDEEKTTPRQGATVPAQPEVPVRGRPEFDFKRDPRHDSE
jgi:hypothetical protein